MYYVCSEVTTVSCLWVCLQQVYVCHVFIGLHITYGTALNGVRVFNASAVYSMRVQCGGRHGLLGSMNSAMTIIAFLDW